MPTRYTLHLTGEAARKAHLRTILKTMGFTDIIIKEQATTEENGPSTSPKVKPDNVPTSDTAKAVAKLFGRQAETEWAEEEIAAFKTAVKTGMLNMENMQIITTHYQKERRREGNFCRTSLLTFLRHIGTELDKARAAKPKDRKLEWPQNVVKLPVVDEAEADRIRELAKQQAQAYRNEARP